MCLERPQVQGASCHCWPRLQALIAALLSLTVSGSSTSKARSQSVQLRT